MKLLRGLGIAAALAFATPALAQGAEPLDCVRAYSAASVLHGHLTGTASEGKSLPSLGALTDNWNAMPAYELSNRANAVIRQTESEAGGRLMLGTGRARDEGRQLGDDLFIESASTTLNSVLAPDLIFAGQRRLFVELRACDVRYGFTPVLGEPPSHEQVLAVIEQQEARADAARQARWDALDSLDHKQCAARFYVLAALAQDNPAIVQGMQVRMGTAMREAGAAEPRLTPPRLQELVQREITERGSKVRTPEDVDPLLQEVNVCERKYGVELTTRQ